MHSPAYTTRGTTPSSKTILKLFHMKHIHKKFKWTILVQGLFIIMTTVQQWIKIVLLKSIFKVIHNLFTLFWTLYTTQSLQSDPLRWSECSKPSQYVPCETANAQHGALNSYYFYNGLYPQRETTFSKYNSIVDLVILLL